MIGRGDYATMRRSVKRTTMADDAENRNSRPTLLQ